MKSLLAFFVLFFHESYFAITYPFVKLFIKPQIYHRKDPKGTIVLVGCWFTANVYHNAWVTYLEKKGYRTYLINLPFARENFDTTTRRLGDFITKRKLKNYNLVGISSGVLVCWNYLNTYKKWNEIHKFISIGGPVQGTITAYLIPFTSKGRAMIPGSKFIKKLQTYPIPKGKMVTISARFDELVPSKYSKLEGVTHYRLSGWGHNSLHLSSKETYAMIVKIAGKKGK